MQSAVVPASCPGSIPRIVARRQLDRCGIRARHRDGKMRAAAGHRVELDRAAEHARHAFDDRQSQAQPARDAGALLEAMEFDEDVAPLRLGDADAGVIDVDAQVIAAPPAADQHAARRRVFDRIGDQILHQPAQQPAVGAHHQRARHVFEFDAFGGGQRREFELDLAHEFVDAEAGEFRAHRAGVEPRHVEQRAEDFLNGLERGIDIVDQAAVVASAGARSGW